MVQKTIENLDKKYNSNVINLEDAKYYLKSKYQSLPENTGTGTLEFTIKKKLTDNNFFKYVTVGTLNTIFGYGVFSSLIFLGLHYPYAVILGTIISVMFNFNTIGRLVFKNYNHKLITRFVLVYTIIAALNIILLEVAVSHHISVYLAGAILLMPLGSLSFILNKTLVFKQKYCI